MIPIVFFGASYYYKNRDKINGFILGGVMLATGIILDIIITMPLFIIPQGISYVKFFLNSLALIGYAEFIILAGLYWLKKVK